MFLIVFFVAIFQIFFKFAFAKGDKEFKNLLKFPVQRNIEFTHIWVTET